MLVGLNTFHDNYIYLDKNDSSSYGGSFFCDPKFTDFSPVLLLTTNMVIWLEKIIIIIFVSAQNHKSKINPLPFHLEHYFSIVLIGFSIFTFKSMALLTAINPPYNRIFF